MVSHGGLVAVDVVIDAVDLEVVGRGYGWQQEGQQQYGKAEDLFHNQNV